MILNILYVWLQSKKINLDGNLNAQKETQIYQKMLNFLISLLKHIQQLVSNIKYPRDYRFKFITHLKMLI